MKKVLILNVSHSEVLLIKALKEMGHYVIGTGGLAGQPGEKFVDTFIQADYSDKEKMLKLAVDNNIDAICANCNDFGVISAAYVAEKLGLSGHDTYENALTLHHKDKFKIFAQKHNLCTPKAVWFEDIKKAKQWAETSANFPVIVKPVDLTGGKGVSRADNTPEAIAAIESAFKISRIKHIVIEDFIDGTQHAMCTFLINKKVVAICSNNEYSFKNPFKVEIDTYPSDNEDIARDFLVGQIEKIAEILNLKDGIFHVQYRMKNSTPYIIEPMRRVLGNLYGITSSKLNGFNWDYFQAKTYLGESLDDFPKNTQSNGFVAHRSIMSKKNGIVENILIPKEIEKYVFDRFMMYHSGIEIHNYMNDNLGVLFFKFSSREEMNHIMLDQYDDIKVIMK